MRHYPRFLPVISFTLLSLTGIGQTTMQAGKEMTAAALAWLDSLPADLRQQSTFALSDKERENWHYIPKAREGLPLADMSENQRKLARNLLASGLSESGLLQAEAIIALERVLRAIENSAQRDELRYYFTVFGNPTIEGTWGWRVEGHHLSVNFTIVDGAKVSATPNFMGANPAEVRIANPQKGKRALAREEDLGRQLVLALNSNQRRMAVISEQAPNDILTRAEKEAKPPETTGLNYASMNPDQQTQLQALVKLYANRLRSDVAEGELNKIENSGWNRLNFAWAGSLESGQRHYYRIQSPEFVIEYDNTQNDANHVHTVWRVFTGDFGRDLLQQHYRESHH